LIAVVQHKTQLGGNKYIHGVTIWMSSDGNVQMMFWVKDAPTPQAAPQGQSVRRGQAPKSIVREHRVLAKL